MAVRRLLLLLVSLDRRRMVASECGASVGAAKWGVAELLERGVLTEGEEELMGVAGVAGTIREGMMEWDGANGARGGGRGCNAGTDADGWNAWEGWERWDGWDGGEGCGKGSGGCPGVTASGVSEGARGVGVVLFASEDREGGVDVGTSGAGSGWANSDPEPNGVPVGAAESGRTVAEEGCVEVVACGTRWAWVWERGWRLCEMMSVGTGLMEPATGAVERPAGEGACTAGVGGCGSVGLREIKLRTGSAAGQ
jgi:hypothetical protein